MSLALATKNLQIRAALRVLVITITYRELNEKIGMQFVQRMIQTIKPT